MASDVKWIKITTDVFDDEKILLIESLPDAYAIIVVWFKLLCLAGKQNNSGVFMMGQIAYTDKMLATIFRMKESTVTMALQTFEQFGMVEIIDGVITIPNWNKHQTLDAYEKKKERDRIYQAERRAAQKALIVGSTEKSSDSPTIPSSDVVVSDKEEDKEIDKEEDKKNIMTDSDESGPPAPPAPPKKPKKKPAKEPKEEPVKHKHGEFQHVLLTDDEFEKLAKDFGVELRDKAIRFLDEYIEETGYKKKSHNLTIRRWVIDAVKEKEQKQNKGRKEPVPSWMNKKSSAEKYMDYGQRQYSSEQYDDLEAKLSGVKTAGNDPELAARAEALRQKFS